MSISYICNLMNIAVYSAFISPTSIAYIKNVVDYLNRNNHEFILIDSLRELFR